MRLPSGSAKTKAIVFRRQGLDDLDPGRLADRVERRHVIDEHVRHVDRRGLVITLLAEVDLGVVLLQHHKAHRTAVLEHFPEPEDAGIEGVRRLDVPHADAWRDAPILDVIQRGISHRSCFFEQRRRCACSVGSDVHVKVLMRT
jgi:hypothetical protein